MYVWVIKYWFIEKERHFSESEINDSIYFKYLIRYFYVDRPFEINYSDILYHLLVLWVKRIRKRFSCDILKELQKTYYWTTVMIVGSNEHINRKTNTKQTKFTPFEILEFYREKGTHKSKLFNSESRNVRRSNSWSLENHTWNETTNWLCCQQKIFYCYSEKFN